MRRILFPASRLTRTSLTLALTPPTSRPALTKKPPRRMVFATALRSKNLHGSLQLLRPPLLNLLSPSPNPNSRVANPSSLLCSAPRTFSSPAVHEIDSDSSALYSNPQNAESTDLESKPRSLYSIFAKPSVVPRVQKPPPATNGIAKKERRVPVSGSSKYRPMEEKKFPKELSPEMLSLVRRLEEEGYLKDSNFSREGPLDPMDIPATLYSRHFLKSAAEKFGQDHQEIAKWLSGSDLKKIALFGCPSIERKTVFAAKRLRSFFSIQEDVICRGCKLKSSCKFVNQGVVREKKLILADVMRILAVFALDSVPKQLFIPNDLKFSVSKLLKEVVSLSN
uniref:Uncharacterized protein LOC105048094 n=1 Tax=Elaeis guineensis var. tenera TaxID=51953 RepID=A0A6I9RF46_ELAGV|nr:uncharacterized protein LOC105048094 [Elaeis guineensis]